MTVNINCPLCKTPFIDWRTYAQHIIDEHPDDEGRFTWATNALNQKAAREPIKVRIKGK